MAIRLSFAFVAAALVSSCATPQNIVFSIKGRSMSCQDARGFITQPDAYFQDWSDADFDTGISVSEKYCFSALSEEPRQIRSRLSSLRNEKHRRADALAAERLVRQAEMNKCFSTPGFKLYAASRSTVASLKDLNDWMDRKKTQDDYARESGVRDLYTERQIGVMIVETRKKLFESFNEYKTFGGKARDPAILASQPQLPDPCAGAY